MHSFRNSEPDSSPKIDKLIQTTLPQKEPILVNSEAATGGVLSKKLCSEISQISQENTCVRVLVRLQVWRNATSLKRDSNTGASLWNVQKFWKHQFWVTPLNDCFYADFRKLLTHNCLAGCFFNLLKTYIYLSMDERNGSAQVSQISSEIFNGSDSKDLQQELGKIVWGPGRGGLLSKNSRDAPSSNFLWVLRPCSII